VSDTPARKGRKMPDSPPGKKKPLKRKKLQRGETRLYTQDLLKRKKLE